ncbi:MAG: hypothetical protein EZS28_050605, partial [Streblomastix strix]
MKLRLKLINNFPDHIGGRLLKFQQVWNSLGATYILKAGAQANWISPLAPTLLLKQRHYSEFQGPTQKIKVYMKALKEELDLGIVREVKDKEIMFYNKTFIIPRKDGRLRMIIDCRPINKYLKDVPFQNENFQNVCNLSIKGDWATIIDIHNAYYRVLVSDELQKFLAFGFQGHACTY